MKNWRRVWKFKSFRGDENCEKPLLLQKASLRIPHHRLTYTREVLKNLRDLEVVWLLRDYVLLIGSRDEIAKTLENLTHRNIRYRIVTLKFKYPEGFQLISGLAWVKKPN